MRVSSANVEILDYEKDPIELQGKNSPDGKGAHDQGIEVGHIFQLGQKYSEKKRVVMKNDKVAKNLFMGCYGMEFQELLLLQ